MIEATLSRIGITLDELQSNSRKRELVCARRVVAKILRDNSESLHSIGRVINRDHSTVAYLLKDFDVILKCDEMAREMYDRLTE